MRTVQLKKVLAGFFARFVAPIRQIIRDTWLISIVTLCLVFLARLCFIFAVSGSFLCFLRPSVFR